MRRPVALVRSPSHGARVGKMPLLWCATSATHHTFSARWRDMQTWHQKEPIYQQLASILAAQLLDGDPPEGEAMPSVRALSAHYLLNPLTVNRALQALDEDGVLEARRGLGLYVRSGAREKLKAAERQRFLHSEWPRLRERLRRLDIGAEQLNWVEQA
jgi:GntR family transcriptional regulator